MDQLLGEIIDKFEIFILILVRMAGLFLMSPVFGRQNVPAYSKVGLSLLLSYMVYSNRYLSTGIEIQTPYVFGILIFREILVGFVIGYVTTLIFSAIWTAGQLIDTQIGFGIVSVIDPQNSIQVPLMGNFKNILALLVFFVLDGHHTLIELIFGTYELVPLGEGVVTDELSTIIIGLFSDSFLLALKIALPVFAITFISEVAFGILVRVIPQMNIFIVGIPIKIFIGLVTIMIFIPLYINSLKGVYNEMFSNIGSTLWRMVGK